MGCVVPSGQEVFWVLAANVQETWGMVLLSTRELIAQQSGL